MKAMRLAAAAVLALIASLVFLTAAATAQGARCASLADVLADLRVSHDEAIVWEGSTSGGQRLLVTAAPDGSTWTALAVDGPRACLVAAGVSWSGVARPAGEDI